MERGLARDDPPWGCWISTSPDRPDPRYDIAYALEYSAPFRGDDEARRSHHFSEPPDRRRRIEVFASAYGLTDTAGLIDAVIERQRLDAVNVQALARRGLQPQLGWLEDGTLAELDRRVRWSQEHRHLVE